MTSLSLDISLYFVVGPSDCAGRPLVEVVEGALKGGVTLLQLRDKNMNEEAFIEVGKALLPLCRAYEVPLIVNDRLEAALAIGADGVHVGQDDLGAAEVRARLGNEGLLGVSAANPEELARVPQEAVDYLGVGPINPTKSKGDAGAAIGPEGIAPMRALTALPLVAIGGLGASDAAAVIKAGAQGLAVVSAIAGAADPEVAARNLREAIRQARDQV